MYCRNCGHDVPNITTPCESCGFLPLTGMNYCQECGAPTKEGQILCTGCKKHLKFAPSPPQQRLFEEEEKKETSYRQPQFTTSQSEIVDEPNVGANVAACCSIPFTGLPIVGFVLYMVWHKDKPKAANSVCLWSIVPFIVLIIIFLLFFVIGAIPTRF